MKTILTKGEKTRQQIIEAAYELFLSQGYHGTSMRQIAERAAIALGGIYNHFTGKEDVFEAVFLAKHPYKRIADLLNEIKGENVEEIFHELGLQIWHLLSDRKGIFNIIFIEIIELKSGHLNLIFNTVFPAFVEFIDRIRSTSPRIKDIPSPRLARTLIGTLISMQITEVLVENQFDEAETLAYIQGTLNIFLNGILD